MTDYRKAARASASKYGLNPSIFERQINAESAFNPNAGSGAGAIGIAQFMPATARSLGINPRNPLEALDGAAKLMAGYVRKYGSYEKALRAYNAGEGAIEKSKGYGETNAYVAKILNGKDPGGSGAVARAARVASTRSTTTTSPGTPATPEKVDVARAIVDSLIARKGGSGSLLHSLQSRLGSGLYTTPGTPAVPGVTTTESSSPAVARAARAASSRSPAPAGKGPGKLLELFWQGAGGINAKNGAKVAQGFVSGHTDHVHVAADTPAHIIALGRIAQQKFGLHVGEQPHFGAVHQVHVANSNHYSNRAIDVSGDAKKMRAFAHYVAGLYGVK